MAIGRVWTAAALLAAAALALPQSVGAQSLGEAAERAKKERKGKPSKVITESDLRSAGGGAPQMPVSSSDATEPAATGEATSAGESTSAAPAGGEATRSEGSEGRRAKTDDELRAEAEADWRDRLQKAQVETSRLSSEADRLQTALNDITQNLYGNNRATMIARLEEVQRQLVAARQSVTNLEEEGRRARYRP
jgi:hypothetical protein